MSFREEFRWKKLGFSGTNTTEERFFMFQWRLPNGLYMAYRIGIAFYCIIWLIYTATDANSPLPYTVYLTTWTYSLETAYFMLHALFATFYFTLSWQRCSMANILTREQHQANFPELHTPRDEEAVSETEEEPLVRPPPPAVRVESPDCLPWYVCVLWVLFSCLSAAAFMVSIVFWTVLVPGSSTLGSLTLGNVQLHLINSLLVFLEQAITAFPVRVLHVIYPVTYGIIYLVFSVFYWSDDHSHVMYSILDWNEPGPTVGYVLGLGFVVIPILHLIMYGIYRIKVRILRMCYP